MKILKILNATKHTSSTTKYYWLMYFYFIGRAHLRDISAFIYLTFYSGKNNLYSEEICFSGVMVRLLMSCQWQISVASWAHSYGHPWNKYFLKCNWTGEQRRHPLYLMQMFSFKKKKISGAFTICEINLKWSTSGNLAHSTDLRSFCAGSSTWCFIY